MATSTTTAPNKLTTIKAFFESNGGKKVSMDELKALSPADKTWLADEAAKNIQQ